MYCLQDRDDLGVNPLRMHILLSNAASLHHHPPTINPHHVEVLVQHEVPTSKPDVLAPIRLSVDWPIDATTHHIEPLQHIASQFVVVLPPRTSPSILPRVCSSIC